jgi:hypothetical protein
MSLQWARPTCNANHNRCSTRQEAAAAAAAENSMAPISVQLPLIDLRDQTALCVNRYRHVL